MSGGGYQEAQARGDLSAYERYLKGMDASMKQKVALTAAHLLCEGKVADMGMGSGQGSQALAALYPRLEVIGVDIDATVVELARQRLVLPNLSFAVGDIAGPVFAPGSLDGIFDSSVLHHVTSYGGYRHENAADAVAAQVRQLGPHGVLVVRDFVDPGPGMVWLDLPADDGDDGDDPRTASSAALLERFAREFRSLAAAPGFPLERPAGAPPRPGWRRYRLARKHAAEFVLRKDYRQDWEAEVKEEYTYFTQAGFEALFARLGLRVLASLPIRNPWIVRHRFRGKFELRDEAGQPLSFPATNYLIVGEKVAPGEGVAFRGEELAASLGFLALEHHRHRESGRVYDLAHRPHPTVDVVPYFPAGDTVYVLARTSYPRPVAAAGRDAALDGSGTVAYVAEPLNVVQDQRPLGATVEEALARGAGIAGAQIKQMMPGTTYYPSPGGILEEVRSVFVEIEPRFVNTPLEAVSGFSTSGRVRAIEARQLLRAAQVGGLPDARLEINVHDLLLRLGRAPGPWIGEEVTVGAQALVVPVATSLEELAAIPRRRCFERAPAGAGFLKVRAFRFTEVAADGTALAAQPLELVEPGPLGSNSAAVALLARDGAGRVVMGLDEDDLPAAQLFNGNSNLVVTPAWRLPRAVTSVDAALAFVRARLAEEYGLEVNEGAELGGAYRPSPGLTPELVFPLVFEVRAARDAGKRPLRWVPLEALGRGRAFLTDGHLRVLAARAAHATAASP